MPTCHECKKTFPTVKAVIVHLMLTHSITCNKRFTCGEPGCFGKFSLQKSFRGHLKKVHIFSDDYVPHKADNRNVPNPMQEPIVNENYVQADHDGNVNPEAPQTSLDELKSAIAAQADAFVAKLYSKPTLPRNHVQHIIDDTNLFLGGGFLNILREKCLQSLNSCNADVGVVSDIQQMFEVLEDPFRELKTEYNRLKRLKESGDYIPPESYCLGKELIMKRTVGGVKATWADVHAQVFPLRKTLKKFLELPNCLDDIIKYIETVKKETETISNFVQGNLWQSKIEKFSDHDIVLPLFVFFDDFECNNPLGPNSGKLGAVYATIASLPQECRSALKNIFLALLFNSRDREEFKNEKVLESLINELKFLEEEGISVQTSDGEKKVYFVLGLVIGDNLGVHQICGFVGCFSANYPCRFCKACKEHIQGMLEVDETLLRNAENYNAHLLRNDVSQTGICEECEFNKVPSFHVSSNYAVDVMHDLAEGVNKYVMGVVVSDLVAKKRFTLYDLNNRIRMFDFGPDVRNKPPVITEDHMKKNKIKMTSSQSFCFVRHFSILVGDLVQHDDVSWHLYLSLRQVIDVALAKSVPKTTHVTFPALVRELLYLYKKLGNNIKPKFHFLLHYAVVFVMCGPVSNLSCVRFEGKHRQLKHTSDTIMARVDLSYSIGVKHQLNLCNRFKTKESILPRSEVGPAREVRLMDHERYLEFLPSLPEPFRRSEICSSPKWVEYNNVHYKPSKVLVTGRDDELMWPTFGKIQFILIDDKGDPVFVCSVMENIGFSDHYHAFEVAEKSEWFCICVHDLIDPQTLYVLKSADGLSFITLRY